MDECRLTQEQVAALAAGVRVELELVPPEGRLDRIEIELVPPG